MSLLFAIILVRYINRINIYTVNKFSNLLKIKFILSEKQKQRILARNSTINFVVENNLRILFFA